ncbi:MAG: class I SAM-dependent methyltransferase [bacterium]
MAPLTTHASYDEVPYDGGVAHNTHPQNAAVIARLFGLTPASVDTARVLEIGCGAGRNLIPMAYALPGSTFFGMDLSPVHISQATAAAEKLGLTNITFQQSDVRDFQPGGQFDYIICHGVFSWVPLEARAAILRICRSHLAPNGIANISYNVLPGWHARGALREMMRFHARHFPEHTERIGQARAFASFLADATSQFATTSPAISAYHELLAAEVKVIQDRPDFYVMHEHLAEVNDPTYFLDFVDLVDGAGLQYLGDANFASMLSENLPPEVRAELDEISPNHLIMEQYRDFLVNRTFRQSLLVHSEAAVSRKIDAARIRQFSFRAALKPQTDGTWWVPQAGDTAKELRSPVVLAILETVASKLPNSIRFDTLLAAVPEATWPDDQSASERPDFLAALLLSLFAADGLEFRCWDPAIATAIAERPRAFGPALFIDNNFGTPSPFHVSIGFDRFVAWLMPLLHGVLTTQQLTDVIEARISDGSLTFESLPDGISNDRALAEQLVETALEQLLRSGILEP